MKMKWTWKFKLPADQPSYGHEGSKGSYKSINARIRVRFFLPDSAVLNNPRGRGPAFLRLQPSGI